MSAVARRAGPPDGLVQPASYDLRESGRGPCCGLPGTTAGDLPEQPMEPSRKIPAREKIPATERRTTWQVTRR
jgi:hypothetical protein